MVVQKWVMGKGLVTQVQGQQCKAVATEAESGQLFNSANKQRKLKKNITSSWADFFFIFHAGMLEETAGILYSTPQHHGQIPTKLTQRAA
jgi:hypothetical protein